jgi:hypothetical protein
MALAGLQTSMKVDDEGFHGTDGEANEIDEMLIMGLPVLVIDALGLMVSNPRNDKLS